MTDKPKQYDLFSPEFEQFQQEQRVLQAEQEMQDLKRLIKEEQEILQGEHRELYLDCMNNKLLKDRQTPQEKRDGLILYFHVWSRCRN